MWASSGSTGRLSSPVLEPAIGQKRQLPGAGPTWRA